MGVLDWLYWPVNVIHNWVLCKIPGISKITPDWFFFKDSPSKWEIPYFHHVIDPIFGPPVGQRRKVKDELKNMMDKYVQIGGNRDAMRTISDEIRKNKTFSKNWKWWGPAMSRREKWYDQMWSDMREDKNAAGNGAGNLLASMYQPAGSDLTSKRYREYDGLPKCKKLGKVYYAPNSPVENVHRWFKSFSPTSGKLDVLEDETPMRCENLCSHGLSNVKKVLKEYKHKLSGKGVDGIDSYEWDEQQSNLGNCLSAVNKFDIKK